MPNATYVLFKYGIHHKIHPGKTGPYLCCIPKVQPVSLKGGHGGSGVNLQLVV